jgi:hypothetical protein
VRSEPVRHPSAAGPHHDEAGNTLLLVPVGVLILLILGAIAVDFAVIYTGQREVAHVSAGLANDAAGAIDEATFFADGTSVIDLGRARDVVAQVVANRHDDTFRIACPGVRAPAPDRVEVACTGEVDLIFSPAIPGTAGSVTVRASSTARAAGGP